MTLNQQTLAATRGTSPAQTPAHEREWSRLKQQIAEFIADFDEPAQHSFLDEVFDDLSDLKQIAREREAELERRHIENGGKTCDCKRKCDCNQFQGWRQGQ